MTIRVLIVDDSALMRALITRKLAADPQIEVVAAAPNAAEARSLIKALDPDVVTLDIEMPGMDGLSFLEKIMQLRPTPVIVVSGSTGPGAEATARALSLGAVACYAKSSGVGSLADDDGGRLIALVREAAQVRLRAPPSAQTRPRARAPSAALHRSLGPPQGRPGLIAFGSSTGGVEALHTVLSQFPADCPPTLVVQHINACFAAAIARSLDAATKARVALAQPDRPLVRGEILIAPGDGGHLTIKASANGGWRCRLRSGEPVSGHCPSVDALFHSVALEAGPVACGILLTGMGQDGAEGLLAMRRAGAETIAQDEASCVVFGMPRAAIQRGAARHILPLDQIGRHLLRIAPNIPCKAS
ncbi:MAG: chemotaxis response regulator protein-glutamate methylesterase [Erythrobacter sp.]|jgi:two-component system chemotaxis response regulator CheB|nr:chemotaxis response regulator protein-glutamate methylesterase [Erythrobacter sp.]